MSFGEKTHTVETLLEWNVCHDRKILQKKLQIGIVTIIAAGVILLIFIAWIIGLIVTIPPSFLCLTGFWYLILPPIVFLNLIAYFRVSPGFFVVTYVINAIVLCVMLLTSFITVYDVRLCWLGDNSCGNCNIAGIGAVVIDTVMIFTLLVTLLVLILFYLFSAIVGQIRVLQSKLQRKKL